MNELCDRCGKQSNCLTMSFFNLDMICLICEEKERNHPDYDEAREAEWEELQKGNYFFPGIGLPDDLHKGGSR